MLKRIARFFRRSPSGNLGQFKVLFERFQQILKGNNRVLELISELEDKLGGEYIFDINYLKHVNEQLSEAVVLIVSHLNVMSDNRYRDLFARQAAIREELTNILLGRNSFPVDRYIVDYHDADSDVAELVGGKNAALGEIANRLMMAVPRGFAVSTAAYRRFMEYNALWPEIRKIRGRHPGNDRASLEEYHRAAARLFEGARVPPDVEKAVSARFGRLRKQCREGPGFAVRSSAFGEDDFGRSFAGQFRSFLCCPAKDVLAHYVRVIESRFTHPVAAYGGERIFEEAALPMSVGVQCMAPARVSGVAYSLEPSGEYSDCLAISANFGLGTATVQGETDADYFRVSRLDPSRISFRRTGRKEIQSVPAGPCGTKNVPVPENLRKSACLTDAQIKELAGQVLVLDRYFQRPVDVEWCFDGTGRLVVLQCRPLKPARKRTRLRAPVNAPVVMQKQGQVAQRGIAAGKVRRIRDDGHAGDFPVGAVAVARHTTPQLTSIIRKAAAIITDIGSPTGHMATVAREFGVPMIVGTRDATNLLTEGSTVTVDAEENIVYQGIVNDLLEYETDGEDVFRDLKEYKILRLLLRRVLPLFLIDPDSPDFKAGRCRTYHDIVRFCHEKAVQILVDLNMSSKLFRGVESKTLKLEIPLGLQIIDLGGGLAPGPSVQKTVRLPSVRSAPMLAILKGLLSPGAWGTKPVQVGLGDLVSSLTRYSMTDRVAEFVGPNLAVVSDYYANVSLRLGYHFNVIDTYVSENTDDNYIYFRFAGGVSETERRRLRASLIKQILEKLHFKVHLAGDLVVGRLKKWGQNEVLEVLEEIGRLIGFTRQLDTQMQSEQSVSDWFRIFFEPRQGR